MTLLHSTVALALAWFAAINIIAAIVTVMAARNVRGDRAGVWRLLPFTVALVFATVLFVPAHLALEARGIDEQLGLTIYGLAAVAGVLVTRSVWRAIDVVARHARAADRLACGAGISLAGIIRPRIVIGRDARAALSSAELELAIAHERAHERSRDNLLRFVMHCAPDVFAFTRTARRLEEQWRADAEYRADACAISGDHHRAAMLASALVKVARLDVECRRVPVWSSFNEPSLLESRVRALLAEDVPRDRVPARRWMRLAWGVGCGAAAAWMSGTVVQLHHATELLIALLP